MLDRFRTAKAEEIRRLEAQANQGTLPAPYTGPRRSFGETLRQRGRESAHGLAIIAEYKRASPSRGDIALDLSPEDVARQYLRAGASALSVLTEETYFKGNLGFLERMAFADVPLLRKDFLFHPLQVRQTAGTPASALLLIVRMFNSMDALRTMLDLTHELGMEAVVEVFDERDLAMAREAQARIIQVNNRDLDTLRTDLAICSRLGHHRTDAEVWIAASGISSGADVRYVADQGYDAMLVGTALMRHGTPELALQALLA